ncbi:hypothetical protein [Acinetobacter sp. NigerLNRRAM0016]
MIFQSILTQFQTLPSGTDAFKQLKQRCEQQIPLATEYSEQAALYLIYGFAKNYVLLYEDQAITPEFAQTAKQQLLGYMSQLDGAIQTAQKADILDSLNQVTADYMQSSRVF